MKILHRAACFTDIHFGRKSNSEQHNQDCLNYIDWFCSQVEEDGSVDHIVFMGDWHENRNAINILTMDYSYRGARKLNSLGLPIYFMTGNHDLYHRHTREIHSIIPFHEFQHIHVISEPEHNTHIGNGVLFSPYLFHHEYQQLKEYMHVPVWMGHFEFKDFVITGYNITMPTGPEPKEYNDPKFIFSGHFHKRQCTDNIHYIGNAFPMDFGDAGDFNRGMMLFDHYDDSIVYKNWEDCPKYLRTTLTDMIDDDFVTPINARIKCTANVPLSFEESTVLKQTFIERYNLREFVMEESRDVADALSGTQTTVSLEDGELANVNDLMILMLQDIDTEHIDNNLLINIYKGIKPLHT